MISSTKLFVTDEKIKEIFTTAKISNVTKIRPLAEGEFNSIYSVSTIDKDYVIKIAPNIGGNILTYEKGMMDQEVMFYNLLCKETDILVPKIYYSDFSKEIIPTEYFIMEKVDGVVLDKAKLSREESSKIQEMMCEILAKTHKIKNAKFGYVQNGLEDNWYLALKKMIENLECDCNAKGKSFKKGKILLMYVEKYKDILEETEARCVNFDLHYKNLFYKKVDGEIKLTLIDPERSFFGDFMSDVVCIEMMKMNFDSKKAGIFDYNKYAELPINFTREEKIRYYIMLCYVALIMYTEKFYRYKFYNFGYWRNVFASGAMLSVSLKWLKSNEK